MTLVDSLKGWWSKVKLKFGIYPPIRYTAEDLSYLTLSQIAFLKRIVFQDFEWYGYSRRYEVIDLQLIGSRMFTTLFKDGETQIPDSVYGIDSVLYFSWTTSKGNLLVSVYTSKENIVTALLTTNSSSVRSEYAAFDYIRGSFNIPRLLKKLN